MSSPSPSSAPGTHAIARLLTALDTLDHQMTAVESRFATLAAKPPVADEGLIRRHAALKQEVSAVIADLDAMLGAPMSEAGNSGASTHG